jgi:hypothetical protein
MYEPQSVIIRLSQGELLGETMSRLRTWLDSEKIQSSGFTTSAGAMGYTFTIGFRSIIDADRFRAQFGMSRSPLAEIGG